MLRTSATGSKHRPQQVPATRAGFTLLELLVALAIAALVAVVSLPMLRTSPVADLKSSAQIVAAALRQTRAESMDSGRSIALLVDTQARTLQGRLPNATKSLASDLQLTLATAETEMQGPYKGGIRFWPDGSATGGRVTLSKDKLSIRVDVEWLTGRVRVSDIKDET